MGVKNSHQRGQGASVRTQKRVRADIRIPSLPLPSLADAVCCSRGREKLFLFYFIYFYKKKLVVVAGLERKKFTIYNFRFSVFNPQTPQTPRAPRVKPREKEGFFGLVPLVTHPSSIPLLGGLTPKFLSLSLHSL
jgi:hypothetical protein